MREAEGIVNRREEYAKLIQAGMRPRDAALASLMAVAYAAVDQIVFPDPALIELAIEPQFSDENKLEGLIGGYSDERLSYFVPVTDFAKHIAHEAKIGKIFHDSGTGWEVLPRLARSVSMKKFVLSLAIHEVRHRVQFRMRDVRTFRRGMRDPDDPLFDELLAYEERYLVALEQIFRKEGASEGFISERCGDMEFDARVIQSFALHALPDKIDADMVREILLKQPART